MSLEFKYYKINDIGEVVSGGTPSTSKNEYWYGDIGWITPKDLSSYDDIYISRGERNISSEGLNNSSAKLVPKNTVLMTSRAPIGYIAIANNELSTNQGFKSLICNEKICHYKYFYYWLKLNIKYIINNSNGSTFKEISGGTFKNLELSLPSLNEQKAMSSVLWTIDEKISVLKRINKNLEQLSQILFKKWLTDFDLKNEFSISEPFKESNLGKIPESWEIKTIGDLSDVKGRIGWRGYTTNDLVDDGPWVVGGKEITSGFIDFNSAKHLTREKYEESPEIMLKDKDLIIAKTGTIGPIAMFYEIYGDATLNPNVGLIRSKMIAPALLLTFFKTPRAQYYLNEFTTSSVQPAINQTTIKQLEVAIPSDKQLLEKIGNKFEEINLLQFNLNEEIKKLQKLRDTLLPKLMTGEIDVSEVNCDLELKYNYMKYLFNQIHTPMSKSVV